MTDPTPQEKARDAIYGLLEGLAEAPVDEGEALAQRASKLADAYSKVAYGPQGGDLTRADSDDYHYTQHQGEDRERPPTGFGER